MDEPQSTGQNGHFAGAERVQQAEPALPAGPPAHAPAGPDSRVGEPTLTSDGELVEAGYGHGV